MWRRSTLINSPKPPRTLVMLISLYKKEVSCVAGIKISGFEKEIFYLIFGVKNITKYQEAARTLDPSCLAVDPSSAVLLAQVT